MMQLEWTTVALQTGTRADGADIVIRWRKHQAVGRMRNTHAVDMYTAGKRCCMFDKRGMTEAQAEYWYERKLRELSLNEFRARGATHAAVGMH